MKRDEKDIFSTSWVDPLVLQEKRKMMGQFWSSRKGKAAKEKLRYIKRCAKLRRQLELNKKKDKPDTITSVWDKISDNSTTFKNKNPQRIHIISIPMGGQKQK